MDTLYKNPGFFIFFFVIFGFLVWWVQARRGYDKRWFIAPSPVISSSFYFALPSAIVGMTISLIGMFMVVQDPHNPEIGIEVYLMCIGFGVILTGYIFAFLEPDWMSPDWYRWLKRNYGDVMPYLKLDAHELGRKEWMRRVATQEGLEAWAKEARQKYVYP